jgi:hypothetical protein
MKLGSVFFVTVSFMVGALLFIIWDISFIANWNSEGSLDIISGAIVEFFFLTVVLQYWSAKNQKQNENQLKSHLKEIEKLLREQKENGTS